ncbi:PglZ domain-containing protein [Bacillus sp. FJAT-52991]|uniref:PglZ domain-containing protein n=1 Tax=Bacillus kandeliae TaxID=3129297 RepID=A0ABZ2NAR0_9BACI
MQKESTRVFVIISDALRLVHLLRICQPIHSLVWPRYKVLTIAQNGTVLADDEPTNGLMNRIKILQKAEPEAIAFRFDDIASGSRATADEQLKGKRLVYVYHDVIDAAGDSVKSERGTYVAVKRAMDDLVKLVDLLSRSSQGYKF